MTSMVVIHVKVNNTKVEQWDRYKVKLYDGDNIIVNPDAPESVSILHPKTLKVERVENSGDK